MASDTVVEVSESPRWDGILDKPLEALGRKLDCREARVALILVQGWSRAGNTSASLS
jgi:hypothetical protein